MNKFIVLFLFVSLLFLGGCNRENEKHRIIKIKPYYNDTIRNCIEYFNYNIDGHVSLKYVRNNEFQKYLEDFSYTLGERPRDREIVLRRIMRSFEFNGFIKVDTINDSDIITESFLFDHINKSVQAWRSPWCKHLSFEEFKLYLLPYRIGREPFEDVDNSVQKYFPWIIHLNKDTLTTLEACALINDSLIKKVDFFSDLDKIPRLGVSQILELGGGNCVDLTNLTTLLMRYAGLPVASVYNREGHYANVLLNEDGKLIHFQGGESKVKIKNDVGSGTKSKIFLKTYHANKNIIGLLNRDKINNIPHQFYDLYGKDISSRLISCTDIEVECQEVNDNDIYYLCSNNQLNGNKWIPVSWIESVSNHVRFNDIGVDNVYVVMQKQNGERKYVSSPFYLKTDSTMRFFNVDSTNFVTLTARRKCKMRFPGTMYSNQLDQCSVHASNNEDFKKFDSLYTINNKSTFFENYSFNNERNYHFYRIYSPKEEINIAELRFCDEQGNNVGTPMSSLGTNNLSNAFDNDISTYAHGKGKYSWIGIKSERALCLNRFKILFRNNLNVIENGVYYKLYMWNNYNWQYIGEELGKNESVVFEHIPDNALYQLRSTEGGVENMAFWIEDRLQKWVRMLPY
jgi:hypothetical protein